jgi:hypothetical protein
MGEPVKQGKVFDPSAMTVDDAAKLLKLDADIIRKHVAAGLPLTPDGKIHLVEYVAWMVQRLHDF